MRSTRLTELLGIELPIIQAPMAGANDAELAIAVSAAGGLGSLPCGMLSAAQADTQLAAIAARTDRPVNANFLCHVMPDAADDDEQHRRWRQRLEPYARELGLEPGVTTTTAVRAPFDAEMCAVVEQRRPAVVSFHFGLPATPLLERVRATGAVVLSSATTVAEARWLEDHGCDVVIAQGLEAGGHRGSFLTDDLAAQVGTMALVPQVVDAVEVPVVAAGGIADVRGIVAALALGAAGVQIGTGYLRCPEATTTDLHRKAVVAVPDDGTVLTNVFTGRPARGIVNRMIVETGPLAADVPAYPHAAAVSAPLRAAAEAAGSGEFSPLWSGQAGGLARDLPAGELTRLLAAEVDDLLAALTNRR